MSWTVSSYMSIYFWDGFLVSITETEAKEQPQPKSPFIKRILLVDDDPDITLTFKAGLDGHYDGDGDKKKNLKYTHLTILY